MIIPKKKIYVNIIKNIGENEHKISYIEYATLWKHTNTINPT